MEGGVVVKQMLSLTTAAFVWDGGPFIHLSTPLSLPLPSSLFPLISPPFLHHLLLPSSALLPALTCFLHPSFILFSPHLLPLLHPVFSPLILLFLVLLPPSFSSLRISSPLPYAPNCLCLSSSSFFLFSFHLFSHYFPLPLPPSFLLSPSLTGFCQLVFLSTSPFSSSLFISSPSFFHPLFTAYCCF